MFRQWNLPSQFLVLKHVDLHHSYPGQVWFAPPENNIRLSPLFYTVAMLAWRSGKEGYEVHEHFN